MIKVETIDNRGFLKRSWKDQRKLSSKLKIGEASLFNNSSTQQQTSNKGQGLKVWGAITKFGSSIINKFRRSNPETIVNVNMNHKSKQQNNVEELSEKQLEQCEIINTNNRGNNYQQEDKKSSILNISRVKENPNINSAFVQLPKKRKIPDSYSKNKYYVNYSSSIDSLKRNVNKRIQQSLKISKIANEQWRNYSQNNLNTDKDNILKKTNNNQQILDVSLGKLNSMNELGHKSSQKDQNNFEKGEILEWLNKIAQQTKLRQQAKLKQNEQKQLSQIPAVVNEKSAINGSSLFSNQNIDIDKSNKSLFLNVDEKPKSLSLFGNESKQQSNNLDKSPSLVKQTISENKNKSLFGGIILQPENQNKQQKPKEVSLFGETKSTGGLFGTSSLFGKSEGLFNNKSDNLQGKQKQETQKKQQKPSEPNNDIVTPQKKQPEQTQNKLDLNKKQQTPFNQSNPPLFGQSVVKQPTSLINSAVKDTSANNQQPKKQEPKQYTNIFVTPKQTKVNLNFEQLFGVSSSQIQRSSNQINDPFRKPTTTFTAPQSVLSWGNTGNNVGASSGGMQTEDMMIENSGGMNVNFGAPQTNNPFQNSSFNQPAFNLGFSPAQAKSNFFAEMNSQNLGSGLITGAASFFQQQVQKPQGLFASPSQPKPTIGSNKGKKSRQQRAFQN